MAAPVVAAIGAVGNAGAIPVPSGVANGSKIVVRTFVHWTGTSAHTTAEITPPAGFSVGGSRGQAAFGGFYWLDVWWWKDATGADSGNYAFTVANSGVATGHAARITGSTAVGTSPFVDTVRGTGSDASSSASIASFTPGGNDSLLLAGVLSGGTISSSGWTTVGTQATNADGDTVGVLSLTQTSAAALNPTFTGSGGYIHAVAATLRGSTSTSVTPNAATHAHSATSPALTEHNALTPANATHAHAATSPSLTQHNTIAPASAAHSHAATSPTLTQHAALAPSDALHGHAATSPTVTHNPPTGGVQPADVVHAHTATSPTLTQHNVIAPNGGSHQHSATSPVLTVHYTIAPSSATHAQTATSPTVSVFVGLTVDSATHAHAATSPSLTQHHALVVDSAIHAHAATSPTVVNTSGQRDITVGATIAPPSHSATVTTDQPTATPATRRWSSP